MNPSPVFVHRYFKLPYSVKGIIDAYIFRMKCLLRLDFKGLRNLKELPHLKYTGFNRRNKYPKTGSPDLMRILIDRLRMFPDVEFRLNETTSKILIEKDDLYIHTQNIILKTQKLELTSYTNVKEISVGSKIMEIVSQERKYLHLLIRFDKLAAGKFSYYRLIQDDIIHRITDISNQTNNKENLLLVGIKENAFEKLSYQGIFEYVKLQLVNLGISNANSQAELLKEYYFSVFYMDEIDRKKISDIDHRMQLNHSNNLMYGIYFLLKSENLIR
jgi:hypothetical protein